MKIYFALASARGSVSLRCKFITEAVNGLDKLRVSRIFFKFLPQPRDMHIYGAGRRHGVMAPDGLEQHLQRLKIRLDDI